MRTTTLGCDQGAQPWHVSHHAITLETEACLQFIDVTNVVADLVEKSGVRCGFVNIQTKHTTTAVIVNEHEPLLLEDIKHMLEKQAPQAAAYRHNDFTVRSVNMSPEEDQNGHAHCKAILLGTSETLNIVDGVIQLGRWQRIFFVELDKAKQRTISVIVMGNA